MTKIYAIPGLRIGYAVAPAEMVARLRRFQQPWTVARGAEAAARDYYAEHGHWPDEKPPNG